ncbi:uncharacterized protein PG998_010952 [Apiospora kogelbergensis]|uniref:uncharacterized protein n=1 Tax=Apiospora kogelbergensis TaxID=1337665 RepID=UPI003131370A
MLRNPLQSAASHGSRPDLHRVADGIASSLRQFSIAQARCDDEPQRPTTTGRQRSAAAVKELFSMSQKDKQPNSSSSSSSSNNNNNGNVTSRFTPRAPEAPKVISVNSLRGGTRGRFAGFRPSGSAPPPAGSAPSAGNFSGNVIRGGLPGGFRGRGGAGGARGGFVAGGRGGGRLRSRAWGRHGLGGRGRGGRRRGNYSDDRPTRGGKRPNRNDEDAYQRFVSKGSEDAEYEAWTAPQADGTVQTYNPAFDLIQDLAGYAPAIASSATPLAQHATALTQARILGGGRSYCPDDIPWPADAKKQYTAGHGIFFPTEEAKKFASRVAEMEFKAPPAETRSAILDAALLGKYDGPKFAQPGDHRGSVKSFVKREGTWNAAAERRIDAKISSLLPSQQAAAAAAARPAPKAKA